MWGLLSPVCRLHARRATLCGRRRRLMSRRSVVTATSGIIVMIFTLAVLFDTWARAQERMRRDPSGDAANDERRRRFTPDGNIDPEIPSDLRAPEVRVTEAPAAFDNLTNGFNVQGPPFDTINEDTVVAAPLVQRQPLHFRRGRDRSPTVSGQPTTHNPAASATRTSSRAARARSPNTGPGPCRTASSSNRWAAR